MSGFQPCVVGQVFGGLGDLCTPGGTGAHITGGWSYACSLQEHGGTWLYGSGGGTAGHCEYTFAGTVSRFGGYFGLHGPYPDFTVRFYDTAGNLLGTDHVVQNADCVWEWRGWQDTSGVGIQRIEVQGNHPSGGYVLMDDMEADVTIPPFSGSPGVLSNTTGGTQTLNLNPGPAYAGQTYLVLGTLGGDSPGLFTNGLNIPINYDGYTYFSILAPNNPPLANSLGVLDALGTAQASFVIPPQAHPLLPGLTAHHAYVVFGDGPVPVIEYASPSVACDFTP